MASPTMRSKLVKSGSLLHFGTSSMVIRDPYGFIVEGKHAASYQLFLAKLTARQHIQISMAEKILDSGSLSLRLSGGSVVDESQLDTFVHNGLPPKHRGQLWLKLSGIGEETATMCSEEVYLALLNIGDLNPDFQNSPSTIQIEKDIHRTFPGFVYTPNGEEFQPLLRRVLRAYSVRNPSLGYCQSMNFLAGGLLVFLTEEQAFWMLCYIVEEVLPGYFTKSMIGPQVDAKVMEELISEHLPKLGKHFKEIGVSVSLFTTQWFMCLFIKTLPYEAAFSTWDLLFYHGPKVLFDIGLSILKYYEPDLLNLPDSVDIVYFLNSALSELYDLSKLWEKTVIITDQKKVYSLRAHHTKSVQCNYDSMQLDDLVSLTRFAKVELEEFYSQYQNLIACSTKHRTDVCASPQTSQSKQSTYDSGLDEELFQRVLQGVFPDYNTAHSTYFMQRMQKILDKDRDMTVDFKELVIGLSVLFRGTLEERFQFCFQIFDADGNGFIDKEELTRLLMSLYYLTTKPGKSDDFSQEVLFFVDLLFQQADVNKDGILSFSEFKEAALLHPFILKFFNLDSSTAANMSTTKIRIFNANALPAN